MQSFGDLCIDYCTHVHLFSLSVKRTQNQRHFSNNRLLWHSEFRPSRREMSNLEKQDTQWLSGIVIQKKKGSRQLHGHVLKDSGFTERSPNSQTWKLQEQSIRIVLDNKSNSITLPGSINKWLDNWENKEESSNKLCSSYAPKLQHSFSVSFSLLVFLD